MAPSNHCIADCIKNHFTPKNMLLRPFSGGQIGSFINNIIQLHWSDPALFLKKTGNIKSG
jgi:hypothetical protein